MMTSRIKAEDELRDVVILQQLPDTDLFSKLGYLFPSLKLELHHCIWPKFCQLLQSVLNFCVWWNNISRKSCLLQTGKCYKEGDSVVCFPSDRHGEGGGAVFLLWWQALFLFCFCFQTHRGEPVSQFILFLLLILDYTMNHLLSGSSVAHLYKYATCAIFLSYRSMGPTLLHSLHASNSSPTGLTHRSPPHFLSFSPFHSVFKVWTVPTHTLVIIDQHHILFSSPIFIIKGDEGEKKEELNAHSVPVSLAHRSAFIFFLLSEEEWQSERWQPAQEFHRSTVRTLNLQPGVCFPHTCSHRVF